jgi:hypothetical protein
MIGRLAIVALAVGLASCAGLEPAGRNARSSGPQPTASAPPPQQRQESQRTAALPPPQATPAPTPQVSQPPQQRAPLVVPPAQQRPAPTAAAPTPPPQRTPPPVAAPQVTAPPAATPAPTQEASARANDRSADDDDIVVRGQVERQVPAPAGDPRTNEERRADVRAWDSCLMQVQSAFDSDPMSAQLTTPEEYCSQSLGMAERTAVPIARQNRRR